MGRVRVVDADSHVEEPLEAWEHLDPRYEARKPFPLTAENRPFLCNLNAFWYIDGRVYPKPVGQGATVYGTPLTQARAARKAFSLGSQGLTDVQARLADMDKAGVDVQVIFPTVFLEPLTEDAAFEAALMASYNTWMAEVCKQRPDRLKWAAVMPLRTMPRAIEELRRARELGAVAAALYGTVGEALLDLPDLDPFYAEAEQLGLPLCVHTGWSHPGITRSFTSLYGSLVAGFTLPVLMGFFALLGGGVLDRFPRLRLAFLEAGVEWVPYVVQRMDHYFHSERANGRPIPRRTASEYLRECEIYFTCEAEERHLPQALAFVGEGRVMISADMPHAEARGGAVGEIQERTDLSERQKALILGENASRFYRI
ncbi:MAG: amidohydrolase family protein [Deltaproteobacteria bacterium]|nr:amidohydrolase family protein [Deltaproteobacteria bacterium]